MIYGLFLFVGGLGIFANDVAFYLIIDHGCMIKRGRWPGSQPSSRLDSFLAALPNIALPNLIHEHFHLIHFIKECAHLLLSVVFLRCKTTDVSCLTNIRLDGSSQLVVHRKHRSNASFPGCSIESIQLLACIQEAAVVCVLDWSWS